VSAVGATGVQTIGNNHNSLSHGSRVTSSWVIKCDKSSALLMAGLTYGMVTRRDGRSDRSRDSTLAATIASCKHRLS